MYSQRSIRRETAAVVPSEMATGRTDPVVFVVNLDLFEFAPSLAESREDVRTDVDLSVQLIAGSAFDVLSATSQRQVVGGSEPTV